MSTTTSPRATRAAARASAVQAQQQKGASISFGRDASLETAITVEPDVDVTTSDAKGGANADTEVHEEVVEEQAHEQDAQEGVSELIE